MHGRAASIRSNGGTNLNTFKMTWLVTPLLLAAVLSGCDQLPTGGSAATTTVVIDLEAVAKVTGQDAVIEQKMTAMREDLSSQLTAMAADLEKQLLEEQAELGDSSDEAAQQRFQQITVQAQQQMAQQRALAQQKAQQFQTGLVTEFRNTVQPISAKIAAARGASVILIFDPMMLWFEPSLDITDEVIDAIRDQNVEFSSTDIPAAPQAAPDDTAAGATEEVLPAAE